MNTIAYTFNFCLNSTFLNLKGRRTGSTLTVENSPIVANAFTGDTLVGGVVVYGKNDVPQATEEEANRWAIQFTKQ